MAEEAELKLNIKKRGICKSKLTNFSKFLTSIVSFSPDNNIDSIKIAELKSRVDKLPDIFGEFDTYQSLIEINHDNFDEQLLEREQFENSYYSLFATANDILKTHSNIATGSNIESGNQGSNVLQQGFNNLMGGISGGIDASNGRLQSGPKLPSIPLPKFSGNFEKWLEFRDTFKSLVHENTNISDIEKFHFLRGSLEGSAKDVLQNLDISSANYSIAWDLLSERYDNKSILVNNYLKSLFGLPAMTRESASELRVLLDGIIRGLRSLKALDIPVDSWDLVIIFFMCDKLDSVTAREWQEQKPKNRLPVLSEFSTFLRTKAELLETLECQSKKGKLVNSRSESKNKHFNSFLSITQNCAFCKKNHGIMNCPDFLKLPVYERYMKAKHLRLCLNCLKSNHMSKDCRSSSCRKCSTNHHTLLHYDKKSPSEKQNVSNENSDSTPQIAGGGVSVNMSSSCVGQQDMLLSTALVQVVGASNQFFTVRALLDSGSQSNLITEELCNELGIGKQEVNISIIGVNQTASCIKYKCNLSLQSLHNDFSRNISCLVVPKIVGLLPCRTLDVSQLQIPKHLKLADPGFATSGCVDLLLGVDIFYQLLCIGQVSLGDNQPLMQKTRFGWILSGPCSSGGMVKGPTYCGLNVNSDLQQQLEKFWSIEEPPNSLRPIMSTDDKECEAIFVKTTKRDENGRFVVEIPFKQPPCVLGNSSASAKRQFFSLERRLQKNPKMKQLYIDFMKEYEAMGHMTELNKSSDGDISYFLPHHGVINENSSTTRLRVVFNGSFPTDNGISLNDIQYTGPNIQDDLLEILLRFRLYNIVVCADVAKMYRMVMVNRDQRSLQKIYWRVDINDELKVYSLNTVTYGTTSASFLAIRCLKQLGLDFENEYPEACNVILHSFFVDDLLFGADTVKKAIDISTQVSKILESGCFSLRKWISNSPEVIKGIIGDEHVESNRNIHFSEENKTLGLYWSFGNDNLMYHISSIENEKYTKRAILSAIAKIYDPLGLLCPCIIIAKIILQKLWSTKVGWDDSLPLNIYSLWHKLRQELTVLNDMVVPRKMVCSEANIIELHGFCDSSVEAYGACLYIKSTSVDGEIQITLVFAKARVAPLKVITIPRLELSGALVLSQLVSTFKRSVNITINKTYLWTDSSVVLGWISQSPHNLQTFVGNRVSQIQSLTLVDNWHHISSKDNPADILSRGCYPEQLINNKLWWNGPNWLSSDSTEWPKSIIEIEVLPELKRQVNTCQVLPEYFPMKRFSNFSRLTRSFAYVLRFCNNCKLEKPSRSVGTLTARELSDSLVILVVISQKESFPEEYSLLLQKKQCRKGPLNALNPFIDVKGVLRVGGRLQLSDLDYAKKHPAVLSCKHPFTKLLFAFEHKTLLHAGPLHLLASIREHYWPIGGRNLARHVVHKCLKCFKVKPQSIGQMMGDLPKERISPTPPFHVTGVDYAGPFHIKSKSGRGAKISKCYVCLFICFSTRAIHLELVSELTSEAFISTFRRFISRRGKPALIWSDNGTNFVGANSELKELGEFLQGHSREFIGTFENEGVSWKFIPSRAPNFGGIWEAGVKSCKFHMKRVMGNASLTFENLYTLLTQIEAILNSRPLVPFTSDPSDFDILTPAHFLIGKRLTALPDLDVKEKFDNRLSKYQYIQKLYQHFWMRWSKEYVILLQQRFKWKYPQKNIQVGELVILREDNLPPLNWRLGRVSEIFLGPDKQCRVVSVKTSRGMVKRPISKICPLPIDNDD